MLLQLSVQIDQHVPARDEIDARKGRILEQAVPGEQHDVAQLARHTIMVARKGEEAPQPFFRQVGFYGDRIPSLPCERKSTLVKVGGKDLQPTPDVMTACFLKQEHGDRVGLFASGAARHPHTNRIGNAFVVEQAGDD